MKTTNADRPTMPKTFSWFYPHNGELANWTKVVVT